MKNQVVCWLGLIGSVLFIGTSIIGGLQIEGYSFTRQYISESYANGVPNTIYLRKIYFLSGALLASFGFLAPYVIKSSKPVTISFVLFAIFYGLATIVTSVFPCDLGCPAGFDVSASQLIHNFSGFLTYAIVPLCLIVMGLRFKKQLTLAKLAMVTLVAGVLSLVFVILLFKQPDGPYIGLFQRIIEGSILIWVIYVSLFLKTYRHE